MSNVAIFVDVRNLYYGTGKKWPGRKLDFKKLLSHIIGEDTLYQSIAYNIELMDSEEPVKFKKYLRHVGFEIRTKRIQSKEERSNWNVGIAVDIFRIIDRVDNIVICSNNPDLSTLVDFIKSKGARCRVVAVGVTTPLIRSASKFIEIPEELLVEEETLEEYSERLKSEELADVQTDQNLVKI